jgi:hypothetical protein
MSVQNGSAPAMIRIKASSKGPSLSLFPADASRGFVPRMFQVTGLV